MDADFLTPETIAADDELQNQLGIPVVMVDGSGMDALPGVYRFMGELLGLGTRAEELAAYCEDTLDTARSITSVMEDSRRISVYYAEGPEGLQTEPRGSRHTQLIPLCGGINAADGGRDASVDMARVSLEQVILWNPQVIITPAEGGGGGSLSYQSIHPSRMERSRGGQGGKALCHPPVSLRVVRPSRLG